MANKRLHKNTKIGGLYIFLCFDVHLNPVGLVRIPALPFFKNEAFMGVEVMANQTANEVPQATITTTANEGAYQ